MVLPRLVSRVSRIYSPVSACFRKAPLSTTLVRRDAVVSVAKPVVSQEKQEEKKDDDEKGYYSWGFDDNRFFDQTLGHTYFFVSFTLALVVYPIIYYNRPDVSLDRWAHQEAYIELNRRESLGLPLVDPDYVEQDKIKLPSDEELRANNIRIII